MRYGLLLYRIDKKPFTIFIDRKKVLCSTGDGGMSSSSMAHSGSVRSYEERCLRILNRMLIFLYLYQLSVFRILSSLKI